MATIDTKSIARCEPFRRGGRGYTGPWCASMEDDEREEAFMCTYEATHVEEADELAAIASSVDGSQDSSAVDKLFDRYHKIVRSQTSPTKCGVAAI